MAGVYILSLGICGVVPAQELVWKAEGPSPSTGGAVDGIIDKEVVGAIQAVTPHPKNPNIVYIGAVNGGIWMTSNAMAASPSWQNLTKNQKSLSIGALEFDPTDSTNRTLIAGTGRFSSFNGEGGARIGLYRTVDGGANWTTIATIDEKGKLVGLNISGVAPRGKTIVISANTADRIANSGVWRSVDGGQIWTQTSGTNKLPTGSSYDLVSDPTNPKTLFTNFGSGGIYRSKTNGATWEKVSDKAIDSMLSLQLGNVKMTVGKHNNVYIAIVQYVNHRGWRLKGVFRSGDVGKTWKKMDLPKIIAGIHFNGQGNTHLSLAADPNNPNIVYIGGDTQPTASEIGAIEYSGRLFRGDASKPPGKQWVHLTNSSSLPFRSDFPNYPKGGGTASNSAPHADSRDMDFAVNGVLIEGDDGGIYRRTLPENNKGDWFSMNGNLQITEFHSVVWDSNSNIIIGGAQDNGTPQQLRSSNVRWKNVFNNDGGDVAVDDSSAPGESTRYWSSQGLENFHRSTYDSLNVWQSEKPPMLNVVSGQSNYRKSHTTPIELNSIDPRRIIFGFASSVYESLDQGDTLSEIGPGIRANTGGKDTIAYGAAGNPDIIYVGGGKTNNDGEKVYIRTAKYPKFLKESTAYPGTKRVVGISNDSNHPNIAYVIDKTHVYRTINTGAAWSEITGNLMKLKPGALRSIALSMRVLGGEVVVGSDTGVFSALGPTFKNWSRLGTGLPTIPVLELEYDKSDNLLLAGTLGRGAWTLKFNSPKALPWLRLLLD